MDMEFPRGRAWGTQVEISWKFPGEYHEHPWNGKSCRWGIKLEKETSVEVGIFSKTITGIFWGVGGSVRRQKV